MMWKKLQDSLTVFWKFQCTSVIQQLDMSCMHETVGYWYLQCLLLRNGGRVWASIKSGLPLTMLIWLSSRVAFIVRPRVRCLASCCISTKGHFKYRTHVIICREKHSWLAHLMTSAMNGLAVFKAIEHKKKKKTAIVACFEKASLPRTTAII